MPQSVSVTFGCASCKAPLWPVDTDRFERLRWIATGDPAAIDGRVFYFHTDSKTIRLNQAMRHSVQR